MNTRAEYFQNLFSKTFHGQRNEKWKNMSKNGQRQVKIRIFNIRRSQTHKYLYIFIFIKWHGLVLNRNLGC